jgi:hypothetical protein
MLAMLYTGGKGYSNFGTSKTSVYENSKGFKHAMIKETPLRSKSLKT